MKTSRKSTSNEEPIRFVSFFVTNLVLQAFIACLVFGADLLVRALDTGFYYGFALVLLNGSLWILLVGFGLRRLVARGTSGASRLSSVLFFVLFVFKLLLVGGGAYLGLAILKVSVITLVAGGFVSLLLFPLSARLCNRCISANEGCVLAE